MGVYLYPHPPGRVYQKDIYTCHLWLSTKFQTLQCRLCSRPMPGWAVQRVKRVELLIKANKFYCLVPRALISYCACSKKYLSMRRKNNGSVNEICFFIRNRWPMRTIVYFQTRPRSKLLCFPWSAANDECTDQGEKSIGLTFLDCATRRIWEGGDKKKRSPCLCINLVQARNQRWWLKNEKETVLPLSKAFRIALSMSTPSSSTRKIVIWKQQQKNVHHISKRVNQMFVI